MSQVDRGQTRLYRSHAAADDGGYMPGTAEERVSQVWELTREAWSFYRGGDAERRLQRDVAVFANRKIFSIEGQQIPVISLEDLITNKRASGRTQDLADVEKLESQLKGTRK